MFDKAPEFNALILFAEHRYYGETQPFGNQSYKNLENLGYLSTEQALADYAVFLKWIKEVRFSSKATQSPIIAFGGSYGGMLAAWIRMKYPHIVQGFALSFIFGFANFLYIMYKSFFYEQIAGELQ